MRKPLVFISIFVALVTALSPEEMPSNHQKGDCIS